MQKVQLTVENSFSGSTQSNIDIGHTVYDRVFNRLLNQNGSVGKIIPIYLKIGGIEKTFGILTLNSGGTYSLFCEIPTESIGFDHITFGDISKDNHHLTEVSETGNKKVLPIAQQELSNGTLHMASFAFQDYSLLKAIPKTIIYPEIPVDKITEIQSSFFTEGKVESAVLLELIGDRGVICIQLFLIPKNVDYKKMEIFPDPFTQMQPNFDFEKVNSIFNCVIPHDKDIEYNIGIICFLYNNAIDSPMFFVLATPRAGRYNHLKIQMERRR